MDKLAPSLTEKRFFIAGRATSLSSHIVAQVRDDLFEKRIKPGDFLGTEMELAGRYDVSRMAARDALRTLSALGIVEIKMGKGGGARIAPGNPRLFAEALAVQLDLTGVTAAEILDAQRAIECMAAELAALNATAADHAKLRQLLADERVPEPVAGVMRARHLHQVIEAAADPALEREGPHRTALVLQNAHGDLPARAGRADQDHERRRCAQETTRALR